MASYFYHSHFVLLLSSASLKVTLADPLEEGIKAYELGDYPTALKILGPLAEQGNEQAQGRLGVIYFHGYGVAQDSSAAAKWYRMAAEKGVAASQFNLGVMYLNAQGVPQNFSEAMKWLRLAANQGHSTAQYNVGLMYAKGNVYRYLDSKSQIGVHQFAFGGADDQVNTHHTLRPNCRRPSRTR